MLHDDHMDHYHHNHEHTHSDGTVHEHEHSHDAEHSHENAHDHSHGDAKKDTEILKVLLGHWVQHNRSHALEYRKWAEKTKEAGNNEVSERIDEAIELMNKVDELLLEAKIYVK